MKNAKSLCGVTLIVLVLISTFSPIYAQSLKQYVPENSTMVLGVNWARLENKLSFTEINEVNKEATMEDAFMELLVKILDNPQKFGLDLKEQTYFFHHQGDTFNNRVMVLGIANKTLFMEKSLEWLKRSNSEAEFTRNGNAQQYAFGNVVMSVTNDMAMVLLGEERYAYHYASYSDRSTGDFNYYKERKKVIRQIDSIRRSPNDPYAAQMEALEMEEAEKLAATPEQEETEELYEEAVASDDYYDEEEGPYYEEEEAYEEEAIEMVEEYDDFEVAEPEYEETIDAPAYDSYNNYDYDKHPLMKALNDKRDLIQQKAEIERKKKQALRLKAEIDRYLHLHVNKTNAKNVKFNAAMNGAHDLTLWINPNLMHTVYSRDMRQQLMERSARRDTSLFKTESSFDKLMQNNFHYAFGDFNQGSFKLSFIQERNKELQEFAYIKPEKVNQTMLSYLDVETFGYMASNVNIPDFFESYRKMMTALIESIPTRTEYAASFEMLDIFVNKDIFYNTLQGDAVIALTGITNMIETRQKYVYDKETFKREYKEVSDTTLAPEILFMASIAKQENVDRLLLAMEHMKLFRKIKNNAYEVLKEPNGTSSSFYVAHHNGILFVTNDKDLIFKNLESTLPKSQQISGQGKDLLAKYGNCEYWDSQKSFDAILSMGKLHHHREKSKMKVLQNHLSNGSMYTVANGNVIETSATLNFSDASINALTELVNLLHEFQLAR